MNTVRKCMSVRPTAQELFDQLSVLSPDARYHLTKIEGRRNRWHMLRYAYDCGSISMISGKPMPGWHHRERERYEVGFFDKESGTRDPAVMPFITTFWVTDPDALWKVCQEYILFGDSLAAILEGKRD